ncbi:MAG: SAM-dependent methyltransferase [Actinobacteria bacterium]|nr:SAM-dependent methyltransferase [Actinomycetota bacterium]
MDCCSVYESQFDAESAMVAAQRYRTDGLVGPARALADALIDYGVEGRTVIDLGGGVGSLGIELVRAGAASAVNVELSSAYRKAGEALALEYEVADRVTLRVADAADPTAGLGGADFVVMNKVVCCYPDGRALMDAASAAATRLLAVSYPSVHFLARAVTRADNWRRKRNGCGFRTYVHPAAVIDRPQWHGFAPVLTRRRPVWSLKVWEAAVA